MCSVNAILLVHTLSAFGECEDMEGKEQRASECVPDTVMVLFLDDLNPDEIEYDIAEVCRLVMVGFIYRLLQYFINFLAIMKIY